MIDGQIYFFPPELARNPKGWAEKWKEPHWLRLVAPENKPSLQGWACSAQAIISAMDAAGIEKAVLHGWYWQNPETIAWHNRETAKLLRAHPDRFAAFAGLHLGAGKAAVEELMRCLDFGFSGIGELLPPVQGFDWDHPLWPEVCSLAREHKLPITLHIDEQLGRDHPGRAATPLSSVLPFLNRHSGVRWILSHLGGLLPFYALNPFLAKDLSRVYFNTAACPLLYDDRTIGLAAAAAGVDKILFASDFPLRIYPRLSAEEGLKKWASTVRELPGLSQDDREAIMKKNWLNLLAAR